MSWEWALLGMRLGVPDAVAEAFLLLTACPWLAAGLFARSYLSKDPRRARFWGFFLATLGGNLGVVVARDMASFYFFYALMTLAAYGLIAHERTEAARRAARVYLVMALLGEMALLSAFLLIAGADINLTLRDVPGVVAASPHRELLLALCLAGFGVKAGALLLHMWLPLAHPVAPTPASAVLSGALIKAGLLGWLRFLPLGVVAMPAHGLTCTAAGVLAAFFGVAAGMTQREPKTVLAYSSVSQMGFMTAALGIGLASPGAAPAAVAAILLYGLHHALAKGALFLGAGVAGAAGQGWPRRLVTLGLLWPALAIAGAPLSTGALAKLSLKKLVAQAPFGTATLPWLLSLAAAGSALLMVHFLGRVFLRAGAGAGEGRAPAAGLWMPWVFLLLLEVGVLVSPPVVAEDVGLLLHLDKLWAAAWPVAAGVLAAVALGWWRGRGARLRLEIPAGDLLYLAGVLSARLRRAVSFVREAVALGALRSWRTRFAPVERLPGLVLDAAGRAEVALAAFGTIGLLFLLLLVFLLVAPFLTAR